jgi:hypothetical protein
MLRVVERPAALAQVRLTHAFNCFWTGPIPPRRAAALGGLLLGLVMPKRMGTVPTQARVIWRFFAQVEGVMVARLLLDPFRIPVRVQPQYGKK